MRYSPENVPLQVYRAIAIVEYYARARREASFACQFAILTLLSRFFSLPLYVMAAFNPDHSVERKFLFLFLSLIHIRSSVLRPCAPLFPDDNRGSSRGKMIFRREYCALRQGKYPRDLISFCIIHKCVILKTFEGKGTIARIILVPRVVNA